MHPPEKRNPMPPVQGKQGAVQNLFAGITIPPGGLLFKELASDLRIHPKTVSRWARSGKLILAFTPGGRARVMGIKEVA